eukprot:2754077-Pyramimonas_sp.AAC.1
MPLAIAEVCPYANVLPGRTDRRMPPSFRTTSIIMPCSSSDVTGEESLYRCIDRIISNFRSA